MIELTALGESLARWIESGNNDPFDLQHAELNANELRALFMSLPVKFAGENEPRVLRLFGTGIRLRNAVITGTIDFRDGRSSDGTALPPLVMEACVIKNPILLARARLQHLSLKASKISHLNGRGLQIEESLDLTELSSAEDQSSYTGALGRGLCWVELQESQIDGMLDADKATFVAPPARDEIALNTTPVRHALDLKHARVRDSVFLFSNVCAIGGVSLVAAHVGGDVQCSGAEFVAVEGYALTAVGAEIGGHLLLRAQPERRHGGRMVRFHAQGSITLTNIRVGGEFSMVGAKLDGALDAEDIKIGANVLLGAREQPSCIDGVALPFESNNSVDLLRAKVSGDLVLDGATVKGGLNVQNAEIAGNLHLCDFISSQRVDHEKISNNRVDNSKRHFLADLFLFPFLYLSYSLRLQPGSQRGLSSASIGPDKYAGILAFDPGDIANFAGTHVSGVLRVELDEFPRRKNAPRPILDLQCATVAVLDDRDGLAFGERFQLRLHGFKYEKFKFDDNTYGNQLQMIVGGLYYIRLMEALFVASIAYVIYNFAVTNQISIFFVILSIVLFFASDWLERFWHGRSAECRIGWLNLQYDRPKRPKHWEYTPEPYECLTQAFRTAGFFVASKRIASRRYQLDCSLVTSPLYRPIIRLFGFFFDYGLSPPRAILTFLTCLCIGWLGVSVENGYHLKSQVIQVPTGWLGYHRVVKTPDIGIATPVLVVNTSTVNSVATSEGDREGGELVTGVLTAPRSQVETRAIPCGEQIDPLLYAVDVFVPALDLGQEQRCQVSGKPEVRIWRIINTLYVFAGWIVTALTILTLSGIMRRQAEG